MNVWPTRKLLRLKQIAVTITEIVVQGKIIAATMEIEAMSHDNNEQQDVRALSAIIESELNSALAGDLAKEFTKGLAAALARGYSEGFAIEFAKEFAQGMRKNALATAKLMLADGMDTEKIKKYTDLTNSQLAELQ